MAALADLDVLRHVPPFAGLGERPLQAIAERCETTTLAPGTPLTTSGAVPGALHVVLRGQIRVVDERPAGQPAHIDELGRGAHAGESVLDGSTAPFSVYCVTDVETLSLAAGPLRELADAWPDIALALRSRLDDRRALMAGTPGITDDGGPRAGAAPAQDDARIPGRLPESRPLPEPGVAADERRLPSPRPARSVRSVLDTTAARLIVEALRRRRLLVAEIAVASVLLQLLSLALPVFVRFVVDDVIGQRDEAWLLPSLAGVCGALALWWAAGYARHYLLGVLSREVDTLVAGAMHRHLLALPLRFFESSHAGDIAGRFEATAKITAFLAGTGISLVVDAVTAVLAVALMLYFDARLALVAVGFVSLEVIQLVFVTPRLNRHAREVTRKEADSEGVLLEALSGLSTIKVLAIEHYTRWKLESRLVTRLNASFRALRHRAIATLASQTAGYLAPVGVLFYGALLALGGEVSVGVLVAFVLLARALAAPVGAMVLVWPRLQDALAAVETVNEVLETAPESPAQPGSQLALQRLHGHVRVEHVSFRYAPDGVDVLRDVSFECYGGQRVAIVGASGSGKSTLIKLLLGFYHPTGGAISVDGFDLAGVWLPSLRRQAGVVLQDPRLFAGTIRANIGCTLPAAPLGDIVAAARMANAHAFITRLAHGYETELDENGANLSGGQRQQIAIARALLHRPRMLILDEATSNLDEESERLVQQSLDTFFKDCTVVTITQRLRNVQYADHVIVLDGGRVVEQGHPEQLLAQRGAFYRLSTGRDQTRERT